jgi:acyl-CoA synthetase (AMP-forming)/AMP-acid ligase II
MSEQEDKTIALEVDDIDEESVEIASRRVPVKDMDMLNAVESLTTMFELFTPSGDEHAMISLVSKFLTKNDIDYEIDCAGNMYFKNHIAGANRFIVNAHMDTVANGIAELEVLESTPSKTIIQSTNNQVIGADDKCGVYAVLKMITDKSIDYPLSGLLCVSEEIGLVGSQYAMEHHSDYFADCIFCITVDRRGNTDIVTTNSDVQLSSDDIITKLDEFGAEFGYKHTTGSISDVSNIVKELQINGINMAAGYYGAHTGSEKVVVEELLASIKWLSRIMIPRMRVYLIGNPDAVKYKPIAPIRYYSYGGWNDYADSRWTYNTGKGVYGGYSAALKKERENDDLEDMLEDALDKWLRILDDIELTGGWYMLDCLAEDASYRLSNSGKSLVITDGWSTYCQEMEEVAKCIDCGYGQGDGDATISLEAIDKYYESLDVHGFSASFDEEGDWV